jgi:hypothetical protein
MSTPDYKLTADFKYWVNTQDCITMPAGTFVRPVEFRYLPKELQDRSSLIKIADKEVFCHTKIGLIPIPKELLRKTT